MTADTDVPDPSAIGHPSATEEGLPDEWETASRCNDFCNLVVRLTSAIHETDVLRLASGYLFNAHPPTCFIRWASCPSPAIHELALVLGPCAMMPATRRQGLRHAARRFLHTLESFTDTATFTPGGGVSRERSPGRPPAGSAAATAITGSMSLVSTDAG